MIQLETNTSHQISDDADDYKGFSKYIPDTMYIFDNPNNLLLCLYYRKRGSYRSK